jgi:hypothetical protein
VARVLVSKAGPLFGQIVAGENSRHRADGNTGTAVDTFHGIDEELVGFGILRFIFLGINSIYRAGIDAGCVLGSNAGFRDHVSHNYHSPVGE